VAVLPVKWTLWRATSAAHNGMDFPFSGCRVLRGVNDFYLPATVPAGCYVPVTVSVSGKAQFGLLIGGEELQRSCLMRPLRVPYPHALEWPFAPIPTSVRH
jgi:hypothetical protein